MQVTPITPDTHTAIVLARLGRHIGDSAWITLCAEPLTVAVGNIYDVTANHVELIMNAFPRCPTPPGVIASYSMPRGMQLVRVLAGAAHLIHLDALP